MSLLSSLFESLFIVLMGCALVLFIFSMNLAWAWAQHHRKEKSSLPEILAAAAIEWGAFLHLIISHFFPPTKFHQAPPLDRSTASPQQIPVIFVPSLRSSSAIFSFLIWRLKKNYWNSLWPFSWKSFLKDPELLEDQLLKHIQEVMEKTRSNRFRLISFGSSRPIVSRLLSRPDLSNYGDQWIAISAPKTMSEAYQILKSMKVRLAYATHAQASKREPDLLITGENDILCYPSEIWGPGERMEVFNMGHFGAALHSSTTKRIMQELSKPL